jgi:3-oxoacyl-(acyl-carrier-protein) synthase
MPNTGGANLAVAAACASGLYALAGSRMAMMRTQVPGEYPTDAMVVIGCDATFAPYHTAPAVAGFSRRAPVTITDMVDSLRVQGRLPTGIDPSAPAPAIWQQLPADLKRRAMNVSSAPFTRFAKGLVAAEGAAALPWVNFQVALDQGLWPSSRLLGIHANAGEGGTANLASMDQGIVTATLVALRMAEAHGVRPRIVQTHGTSTELNNVAEISSLGHAFRYAGHTHPHDVSAIKGLVGHSMGAASAVDLVIAVQSLLEQRAPGLTNFAPEDLDPRLTDGPGGIGDAARLFRFSAAPITGPIEAVLIASEGFLSADAAAVVGHFPQEIGAAVEMLRDYGVPAPAIAEWRARAPDHRARATELEDRLRRGELTHRDVIEQLGYRRAVP